MKIPSEELSRCIAKAQEISEAYKLKCLNSIHSKRSIDLLIEVCQDSSGKTIEIGKVDGDIQKPWLSGSCLQSLTSATILYVHHLNSCWVRFTVCKEAFHVVLDQDEYRETDIFQHIQNIILHFPDDDSTPTGPVICEFLAEVAAMEFLFPYADREKAILSSRPAMEIAQEYKIPCLHVERYMSKEWMTNLKMN